MVRLVHCSSGGCRKGLLLDQEVHSRTERFLETAHGHARLSARYDWDSVVLDATTLRMVRTDFEIFFQREEWFRQHNLPHRLCSGAYWAMGRARHSG